MFVAFHLIRRLCTESVSVRSELSHSHKVDFITCRDPSASTATHVTFRELIKLKTLEGITDLYNYYYRLFT